MLGHFCLFNYMNSSGMSTKAAPASFSLTLSVPLLHLLFGLLFNLMFDLFFSLLFDYLLESSILGLVVRVIFAFFLIFNDSRKSEVADFDY